MFFAPGVLEFTVAYSAAAAAAAAGVGHGRSNM